MHACMCSLRAPTVGCATYAPHTTVGALKLNVCEAMVYAVVNIILSIPLLFRERMQF